jgi:hypothetical protein
MYPGLRGIEIFLRPGGADSLRSANAQGCAFSNKRRPEMRQQEVAEWKAIPLSSK